MTSDSLVVCPRRSLWTLRALPSYSLDGERLKPQGLAPSSQLISQPGRSPPWSCERRCSHLGPLNPTKQMTPRCAPKVARCGRHAPGDVLSLPEAFTAAKLRSHPLRTRSDCSHQNDVSSHHAGITACDPPLRRLLCLQRQQEHLWARVPCAGAARKHANRLHAKSTSERKYSSLAASCAP